MHTILKIGHRGAKGYAPENTLTSFQKALDMQVDGIELDVHLSADGHLMVIHDATVDRTTDGDGFVNKLSLRQLKEFRIKNGHEIPTLLEVVELVNRNCFINIELKTYETTEKVIALIEKQVLKKNWKYTDFLVSSFDWNALQQIRFKNEKIPIAILAETNLELAFSFAKFLKAEAINPYFHLINNESVARIKQAGIKVFAWTINESEDINKVVALKVTGIITDFPNRI